jgi:hypothetical protein
LVEGGGHTDIDINNCAHDGLDYVFYARRELGAGHGVPQEQDVLFGASYSARMEFAGVQEVTVGGKRRQADHVILYLKGPASDYKLEIFFERDPARTPLIVKAPLPSARCRWSLCAECAWRFFPRCRPAAAGSPTIPKPWPNI